ncbi:MAG: hypothetical protein ACYCWW_04475 [Deltaproteobacteria bacterium]
MIRQLPEAAYGGRFDRGVRTLAALSLLAVAVALLGVGLWLERPGGERESWNGWAQVAVTAPGPKPTAADALRPSPPAWRK